MRAFDIDEDNGHFAIMGEIFAKVFFGTAAIWGLIAAAVDLAGMAGSLLVAGLVLGTTVLVATIFSASQLAVYFHNVRMGYPIYRTPSFISLRKVRINVDNNYMAMVELWRDLVFSKVPRDNELIDMANTLPGFDFSDADYRTFDGVITKRFLKRSNELVIQWRPKTRIVPLVPYRHHTINRSPCPYGPDGFYYLSYVDREIGKFEFELLAPLPFAEVFGFVMPRFKSSPSDKMLLRYGLRAKHRLFPQPVLSADRKRVSWKIERPQLGRNYIVAGIFEGQMDLFMANAQAKSGLAQAWDKVLRLGRAPSD